MEDAQLYVSANAMQRRDALLVLSEYLPQMSWRDEGEAVLDVGCGSGLLLEQENTKLFWT